MKPQYVATRSGWTAVSFLWILSCLLIIPIPILICRIIAAKHYTISFYQDKIIVEQGWLSKSTKQMVFMGVASVSIEQSLIGRMCNFGHVSVDCVGKWDVDSTCISNPEGLKSYLETRIVRVRRVSANQAAASAYVHM